MVFGVALMGTATQVMIVNDFDYNNMRRGILALWQGVNPWAPETRLPHFYNPPFAMIFLAPLVWLRPPAMLTWGAALLAGYAFYRRAWVALGWFGTATLLWLIAAGGVDMYLMGMGLWLLALGDRLPSTSRWRTVLYTLAYGYLLVKPQGGLFIVLLHAWLRRDVRALLASFVLYFVLFLPYYPDWLHVLRADPPPGQNTEHHSLAGHFGLGLALLLAVLVACSRPWTYWSLGGALAGMVSPYGMPGVPIFLTLTGARSRRALIALLLYGAGLAWLTWPRTIPPDIERYYDYTGPFMRIFHLGMLGYALTLAVLKPAFGPAVDEVRCPWLGRRAAPRVTE